MSFFIFSCSSEE